MSLATTLAALHQEARRLGVQTSFGYPGPNSEIPEFFNDLGQLVLAQIALMEAERRQLKAAVADLNSRAWWPR